MRPLIRQLWEIGVEVDYRPGGVSMTNRNFAKLERDRRLNAERVLFLLAKIAPTELAKLGIPPDDESPDALNAQLEALDRKIMELHAAHMRINKHNPKQPIAAPSFGNNQELQYMYAMRHGGVDERFVHDAIFDYRNRIDT